jgi:hypothetical protein
MCGASIGWVRSFFEFSCSFLDRVSSLDFVISVDKHEIVVTIVVIIIICITDLYLYIYIYCVYIVYIPSAPFDIWKLMFSPKQSWGDHSPDSHFGVETARQKDFNCDPLTLGRSATILRVMSTSNTAGCLPLYYLGRERMNLNNWHKICQPVKCGPRKVEDDLLSSEETWKPHGSRTSVGLGDLSACHFSNWSWFFMSL